MNMVMGCKGMVFDQIPDGPYEMLQWAWEDSGEKTNPTRLYAVGIEIATIYWHETLLEEDAAKEEAKTAWGNPELETICIKQV